MAQSFSELANFIWSVADILRGDYKQADYGKIILPFTLLRRLDCVLESTKQDVLEEYKRRKADGGMAQDVYLTRKSKQAFYNVSPFTVPGLLADPQHIRLNLITYIGDFSSEAMDVFAQFKFLDRVGELDDKNLLFQIVQKFAGIDLHPDAVPNETMGLVFEELIRKFAEASNETAGEHFTPREVIKLMVNLILSPEKDRARSHVVETIYDPACGAVGVIALQYARGLRAKFFAAVAGHLEPGAVDVNRCRRHRSTELLAFTQMKRHRKRFFSNHDAGEQGVDAADHLVVDGPAPDGELFGTDGVLALTAYQNHIILDVHPSNIRHIHHAEVHADAASYRSPASAYQHMARGRGAGEAVEVAHGEDGQARSARGPVRASIAHTGSSRNGFHLRNPGFPGGHGTKLDSLVALAD